MAEISLEDFVKLLKKAERNLPKAIGIGLEIAAKRLQKVAQSKIGHYQLAVAGFPQWELLKPETETQKIRLGYQIDSPLLRDGDLKDSIRIESFGYEATVFSDSPIAYWQEAGTSTIPPRPFLLPSYYQEQARIDAILGIAVIACLSGKNLITIKTEINKELKSWA